MNPIAIAGEAWELPFARLTLTDAERRGATAGGVLVPAELAGLATRAPVQVVGEPAGRFRGYPEIAAELRELAGPAAELVRAGSTGSAPHRLPPPHRPPTEPEHRSRQVGQLQVWTIDTGEHYYPALAGAADSGPAAEPVWSQYGARRPVFTRNTNDFTEPPPARHDDYVILGSGLLGWRMVLESDPAPTARVLVYDINPDQLAWSRHLVTEAARCPSLDELEASFASSHPDVRLRVPLLHERPNADVQAGWYAAHRNRLADLAATVELDFVLVDLLTAPAGLLARLDGDRSVAFMYLDLFVVWHVHDQPPWITEFPGLARSLEREVSRRSAVASFLPGPGSQSLQLADSPLAASRLAGPSRGEIGCT